MKRNKHGCTGADPKHPLFGVWNNMHQRCGNPNHPRYDHYGGRGITVCERWRNFPAFLADMGARPSPKHSIEREDNNRGYEPDNCCWATKVEQQRNMRCNIMIEYNGEIKCLPEWADITGISKSTLSTRYYRGKRGADIFFGTRKNSPPPKNMTGGVSPAN